MNNKITFFTRHLKIGGLERVIVNLANRLSSLSHDVDIVTAIEEGSLVKDVSNDVRVVNLQSGRVIHSIIPFISYLYQNRPEVVYSGNDSINHLLAICNFLGLIPARLVVSLHIQLSRLSRVDGVWYSNAIPWFAKWTYRCADHVVAVSKDAANDLQSITGNLGDRISVIYNPVVDDTLREKAKEDVVHPWIEDPSTPVILGIGRATPQKNFPLLVRAFEQVLKQTNAKLMILGGGPELSTVREEVGKRGLEDHVELLGYVSNPYAYLARASLYVLSSNFEGLPTTIIEALACGCPVVSTDCPSGPREILEDGRWGTLVPVGDAEALANAMVDTLANPPDSSQLKQRAETFSVDTAVEKYREVFFPDALPQSLIAPD